MKKEKVQKKESTKVLNKILINIIIAIVVCLYLVGLYFIGYNINQYIFNTIIKVSTVVFLILGIVLLERFYKKEDKMIALRSVEVLCIAAHTVSIKHILKLFNLEFKPYIIGSLVAVFIYYVLKCIIIYTVVKRKSLKDLSDISKIVKEDEPVKKEATKKEIVKQETLENMERAKKETTKKTTEKKETTKKEPAKTTTKKATAKKETTKKEPAKTTTKKTTVKKETTNKVASEKESVEEKPKRRGRPKKEVANND